MLSRSLLLPMLVASGSTAKHICGTPEPTPEQMHVARYLQTREIGARAVTGININLYYHVIANNMSETNGFLNASVLQAQTAELNDAYRPHNISWTQMAAEWLIAPEWSRNQDELAMTKLHHKGNYADLNVYIVPSIDYILGQSPGLPGFTITGYSMQFPRAFVDWLDDSVSPVDLYHDGVLIRSDSTPGGARRASKTASKVLVHETGHWLGLYHPFQNGCSGFDGFGDGIDDTPSEARPAYGCPVGRDSCPGMSGFDDVQNYMDYTNQTCQNSFTPGQEQRMYSQWAEFRAKYQNRN